MSRPPSLLHAHRAPACSTGDSHPGTKPGCPRGAITVKGLLLNGFIHPLHGKENWKWTS